MHIQSYQIHNVLNVYRRLLSQGKTNPSANHSANGTRDDAAGAISLNGQHRSIMEKVAASVLKKITNVDPASGTGHEPPGRAQGANEKPYPMKKENHFTFNTIAKNNQKETRSIAVDNSRVLLSRLDELARATIASKNSKRAKGSQTTVISTAERTDCRKR